MWELKYYWEDGVTIECRYFSTKEKAETYAENEGYPTDSFVIVKNY